MEHKKLGGFAILLMLIVGMMPFAAAQEEVDASAEVETTGAGAETAETETTVEASDEFVAQTEAEDAIVTALETADIPKEMPISRCVEVLSAKHPKVDKARIEKACRFRANLRHLVRIADKDKAEDIADRRQLDVRACLLKCKEAGGEDCRARCAVKDIREDVREAKRDYADARERYMDMRQKFMERRSAFMEARQKWHDCKDEQTEGCKRAHEQMWENAKPFLLKAADMVLEALERVKTRIKATDMDAERKTELLAGIDARIQAVTDARTKVEVMPDDASPEELKEAAKAIRDAWHATKVVLKRGVGHVMVAKLGNILQRTKQLETKLQRIRDRLEADGKDVSKLDSLLADFGVKIEAAKTAYTQAREKFASGDEGSVKAAHELVVQARTSLKEARELLKQAMAEIRSLNAGQLEVEAETSVEAEAPA